MPFPGLLPPHSTSGSTSPIPTSNLQVWLKGDAIMGFSDGDRLTTWADSSGNGKDFTSVGGTASPLYKTTSVTINSLPVVQFAASETNNRESITHTNLPSDSWSAATIYVVGRLNNDPPATLGKTGLWQLQDGNDHATAFPFTDSVVYDSSYSTVRKTVGNPTPSLASPFYYGVISASGSWEARLNGSSLFSTGTNTFSGTSNPTSIGFTTVPGGDGGGTDWYDGVMAEVIIYNAALGSTDRATVETYLSSKYGI